MTPPPHRLPDLAADLLLGGRCVGCDRPGRALCQACRHSCLEPRTPTAQGGAVASTRYEGVVREVITGHKERRLTALRPVLAVLLARAVVDVVGVVDSEGLGARLLLVPVPSRPGTARTRGYDPLRSVVQAAIPLLGPRGGVGCWPVLASGSGVLDQAGLSLRERQRNVAGSMRCRPGVLARAARAYGRAVVVLCDDVVTSGSTLAEARRALDVIGVPVAGCAVVAATPRVTGSAGPPEPESTEVIS